MNMLLLLIAAGMGLVVQNLLMVRMTESVSTILITLVINSSVGLLLLVGLLLAKNGLGAVAEVTGAARWWMLLPGLLGSLFVFAGIWATKNWARRPPSRSWSPASCAWGCWWTSTAPARRRCARICRRCSAPCCWWRAPIWWRNAAFDGG